MTTTVTHEEVREYMNKVYEVAQARNAHETEFLQAVKMLFEALVPVFVENPSYMKNGLLERMIEPERLITFQVPWIDDEGVVQVNRGFRVQFNGAIGPYKGGIRFHPSVNASIIKFLGFQQTIKNALTNQAMGGGKGGADFDPKGKSDLEIMRFCQSYMTELTKYIGPDIDVPAGDIGVGPREIGYMFGQYKRLRGQFEAGVFTGKPLDFGGSIGRTEATGYGAIYFVEQLLQDRGESLKGSKVIISGSGNVSIYAMEKAIKLGARIVACSDSSGYVYDENGLSLKTIKQIKLAESGRIKEYVNTHPEAKFNKNSAGIWSVPCELAIPCATQNEMDAASARRLVKNGVKVIAEGANMPCTPEAIQVFHDHNVLFGPAQAVNAGGVAVSFLEMAQNSSRVAWSFERVDEELQKVMETIYRNCMTASEQYGEPGNFVLGASIVGFKRIAKAMLMQGVV
ncbi:MAG TPA: NADP-specific glutamate dehydrogenase [Bacillota bacterium]|nr:NADP-specific glutamate dehydrogenase [Bacillota bacterium]